MKHFLPHAIISSDSVRLRALVGKTNGPGQGPNLLTRLQQELRAAGVVNATENRYKAVVQAFNILDSRIDTPAEIAYAVESATARVLQTLAMEDEKT